MLIARLSRIFALLTFVLALTACEDKEAGGGGGTTADGSGPSSNAVPGPFVDAQIELTQTLLRKLKGAVIAYRVENGGAFPSSLSALAEGRAPYLEELPKDAWDNDFLLESDRPGLIRSRGPDGEAGNEDDITIDLD